MTPDLKSFDHIVINSSAGKDSQAMLDYVHELAKAAGVVDRMIVVHADLGRVEWKGARELAEAQAKHYGIPFHAVRRELGDLLEQVEKRGMWPDNKNRYCTSDQKRDQISKIIRHLPGGRVLNCLGMRSQESPARAKLKDLEIDTRISSAKREVWRWLPIHDWKVDEVWARIEASGVPHHFAYDQGMPRLSCVFCVFASKEALIIAGRLNPELLNEYVRVEKTIGHTFRKNLPIIEVQNAVRCGEIPSEAKDWAA